VNRWIAWFAGNRVAANVLVLLVCAAGLLALPRIEQESFARVSMGVITISVPYPGATPEEISESVCVRIEEAIQDVEGVKRLTSTAREDLGMIAAELERGADSREVLDRISARVEALDTLPDESKRPVVEEVHSWSNAIDVAVSGSADERTLRRLAEQVRDELAELPGVGQTRLTGARPYEISIEVSEERLRRHGLRFDDVVRAVRSSSLDLPGGSLQTAGGEILLRARGQAHHGTEFEDLVVLSHPDGTRLYLRDVATVIDGFAETDQRSRFDGRPAVLVHVLRGENGRLVEIARDVESWMRDARGRMPPGVDLTAWQDLSRDLESRQQLLLRNGLQGLVLVLVSLALFLRLRMAFWVSAGIAFTFLGALAVMPWLDTSMNMLSSLGFLVALGLVADDAIVIAERVAVHRDQGLGPLEAAVRGAREIAVPVVIAAVTTMVAMTPMLFLPGIAGEQMRGVPIIVIACLLFSLLEALLILPAHLAHGSVAAPGPWLDRIAGIVRHTQDRVSEGLEWFVRRIYRPALDAAIEARWLTLSISIVVFALSISLVAGGWIRTRFLPPTESDYVTAILTLPYGTPAAVTTREAGKLEASALRLRDELAAERPDVDAGIVRHVLTSIGEQPVNMVLNFLSPLSWSSFSGAHLAEVGLELAPSELRHRSAREIGDRWRELTEPIPGAEKLVFSSAVFSTGNPVNVRLAGSDPQVLESAARTLAKRLHDIAGVRDIGDSHQRGSEEIRLNVRPEAEALGVSLADLARQIRQGFHGEEVQRIQRGRDDVAVVVRYPADERRSLGDLERSFVRTMSGEALPFSAVAEIERGRGYAQIQRANRKRTIDVTADIDTELTSADAVLLSLSSYVLPELLADHPGVSFSFEGQARQQEEFDGTFGRFLLLELIAIFALLAFPLRSYTQPILILLAVPFGVTGAILGHAIIGLDFTSFALVGIMGLSGVVVNDTLVLIHAVNGLRSTGRTLDEAVREACVMRFRPILATTLTTSLGLSPILMERATQAEWIKPMAVSIAFGELFSTALILLVVPAAQLALADLETQWRRLRSARAALTHPAADRLLHLDVAPARRSR